MTTGAPLKTRAQFAPKAYDMARVARELEDIEAQAAAADRSLRKPLAELLADKAVRHLLASVYGNSPFLTQIIRLHPDWLVRLLNEPAKESLADILRRTRDAARLPTQAEIMRELRRLKSEAALLIALADISAMWSLDEVTEALSAFAEAATQSAVSWLLAAAGRSGQIAEPGHAKAEGSGLAVLAMGKFGSGELNYSSDIDLVVFYEPDQMPLKPGLEDSSFFVQLTKGLVKLLQERTEDGYVFRVDLRLRPDPGGTPVAVSLPAAEVYYESRGQNWERAAFIKARAVAGDLEAGGRFLDLLTPYIWRKNLDFAAIDDIHSMKRQIHAVGGHGVIAVAGHNVKLGRGGIREIEFFVQTQQLIAGGREYSLRGKKTCAMLDQLAEMQWITPDAAQELKEAYRFLRTLEHRLQMINDDQTHSLPSDAEGLRHVALFMGFEDVETFSEALTQRLRCVQHHYANLFETAPPLAEESGSLVFTGNDDDPETIATLKALGFKQTSQMSETIRAWHSGRYAATRSTRAREMLTALMPALLRALAATPNPDTAFTHFDDFLRGLPAGIQLFSMLYSHPGLLDLLAGISSTAPRMAHYLSENAAVLEAFIDPNFHEVLPGSNDLQQSLEAALAKAADYQDVLDFARVWAREYRFRLSVRVLAGSADAAEAGPAYAAIASGLVDALAPIAQQKVAERFGEMPGGHFATLAMGKLGSREMSATSDLDLIMIYETADAHALSDGKKQAEPPTYYARICQQLINALTAPTAEGKLYEVDLRLRPSGNAGPIATSLKAFEDYQAKEAWTWEHMALTRARVISGDAALKAKIEAAIATTLRRKRDPALIAKDVRDMRARIEKEFPSKDAWELKYVRGGLVDLEFISQFLQLIHAHAHPDILQCHTRTSLMKVAEARLIPSQMADALVAAIDLNHNLTQVIRVCVETDFKPAEATSGLKALLARAGAAPDFATLESQLRDSQAQVREAFDSIILPA
ncbi:MAG: bifunctional [glutamine synthetase] adenylyltransferase/[glutamine synthetase]-adenylyl-L-tyrosine phosphorylase [Rhizobiales bacterium]|nr:bifunctional [glutamine synthetase] adenylyltransferase/[glutamine synthetase]-adenylyl-L-tyrosine phosphorylase [Hyphomicrobiales bacterium]